MVCCLSGRAEAQQAWIQQAVEPPKTSAPSSPASVPDILKALSDPSLQDILSKKPLKDDINALLQGLPGDQGVQYLHNIAQRDPALASAIANRALMTQLQTITRWTQVQMLSSLVRNSPDSLAVKALAECVAGKLDALQPVRDCLDGGGVPDWSRVKKYLGVADADMGKEFSVLSRHLPSDFLPFAYTYVGDLRLRDNRIKRVYCSQTPTDPKDKCEAGGTAYQYQDLGSRFGTLTGEVQAKTSADCAPTSIPTQIQWNGSLPSSAVIDVDRPSFILAYKDSSLCGALTKSMTAAALSHEVTYVLASLSLAEGDPSALTEERDAIRLVREDLDRRYSYWQRNFDVQGRTYETFVRQARSRAESEREALAAVILAGR